MILKDIIGYRVRFYGKDELGVDSEDGSGGLIGLKRRGDDIIYGPIPGARVAVSWPYGQHVKDIGTRGITDEEGKYRLSYHLIPCATPEYMFYPTDSELKLYYQRFNPNLNQFATYWQFKPDHDWCWGPALPFQFPTSLIELDIRSSIIAKFASVLPSKLTSDFVVDVMVLSGHAYLANDDLIPIGEQTNYEVKDIEYRRGGQNKYDFDGDGEYDLNFLGRLVETSNPDNGEKEKQFYPSGHPEQGCTSDPEDNSQQTCSHQGIYLSSGGQDTSQAPDLLRIADWDTEFKHQALISEISSDDLQNTDLYIFRASNGELLAERRGVPEEEMHRVTQNQTGVDDNRFFYTLEMRGIQGNTGRRGHWASPEGEFLDWDDRFQYWQAQGGMEEKFYRREADHIRPGERIKIVAINRVTGYIGTATTTLQSTRLAGAQVLDTIIVNDISMRPPNLKIWAERLHDIDQGLSKEKGLKQNIGFEGAGLASDTAVTVYSEWLDHDGSALPAALNQYGYSGRLAKITGPNQLAGVNSQLSQFSIRPGRHTEVIHLSQEGVEKEHLYVQVSATPIERHPDFSNQGIHQGIIQYRPDQFVPFKVPVFDEDSTLLAQKTYRAEKENNPDLNPPKPLYQWLYRPEFQFSVYDLEIQALNRYLGDPENLVVQNIIDEETPIISSSDELIELAYSLLEDEEDMLTAFSFPEERELVFALGEEEVIANIGADQSVSFENLEHLASLDPEDFLSIRLYANNDAGNVLWEYAFGTLDVAVDLNRNGKVEFSSPDDQTVLGDKTSPTLPYLFWINDDYDVVQDDGDIVTTQTYCDLPPSVDDPTDVNEQQKQVCEQWDVTEGLGSYSNITGADHLGRIESRRDLEDFAPLAIRLPPALKDKDSIYLKFTAQGVKINLFKGVWKDDGDNKAHAYVYDQAKNVEQTDTANGEDGYLFEVGGAVPRYILHSQMDKYFDTQGIGRFIFEGSEESDEVCEIDATNCYLLVEVMEAGATHRSVAEERIYLDLHTVTEFYQNVTAGAGADGSDDVDPGPFYPIADDPRYPYVTHIYSGVFPENELTQDYTLLVHGWRMTDPEKIGFANKAFKRFYWSGYKGSFGALTWPTGYFDKPAHAYDTAPIYVFGNEQNYGNSESTARLVGIELTSWLQALKAQGAYQDLHVVAHSMGNVVVSEALLHHQGSPLITSYSPSEAATTAGGYNQLEGNITHKIKLSDRCSIGELLRPEAAWRCYNLTNNTPFDMPPDRYRYTVPLIHGETTDANMAALNIGDSYYANIANSVERIVNFYNPFDAALNLWEFVQLTKPDYLGEPTWDYTYFIRGSEVEDVYQLEDTTLTWYEGQPINREKADILAHIIPARTHALGQRPINNEVIGQSVSLGYGCSNQGHVAQFYESYANRQVYWKQILRQSLDLDPTIIGNYSGLYHE